MMKKDIQILIVDDHEVVRDGLRHMIELEADMEVVGEAADAIEALTQVELLSPEVILMDIKMPRVDGIELTKQLLKKQPSCKVIMLTLYDEYMTQAIEAGAMGYLLKDIRREELAQAIRQIHRGQVVISESIASKSRVECEERFGEKAEVCLLQEDNESDTILREVVLVIHPPVGSAKLARFIGRVEDMLQSSMIQMVGSWNGGSAMRIHLEKPTALADILSEFEEMPGVEITGEKQLIEDRNLSLLKGVEVIPGAKNGRNSRIIFITLKNN